MSDEQIIERNKETKKDRTLFPEIAEILNISVSEIENMPTDVQQLLLHTYVNGTNQTETRKRLLLIVNPNQELQRDLRMDNLKNNPLKNVEELVEGNYNMIDGIINNEPPKRDQELIISREQIKANAERISKEENERSQQCIDKYIEK